MNYLQKKDLSLGKIEFWATTTIYTFAVLFLLAKVSASTTNYTWTPYRYMFDYYKLHYSYSRYYFIPQVFRYSAYYGAFLLWNFLIVPSLAARRYVAWYIILGLMLLTVLWAVFGITDTWLKGYLFYHKTEYYVYNIIFKGDALYALWVMMVLTFYSMIKYATGFLLQNTQKIQAKYQAITHDSIIAVVVWMIIAFILILIGADVIVIGIFVVAGLVAIGLYVLSFYTLIPQTLGKKKGFFIYLLKITAIVLVIIVPTVFAASFIFDSKDPVLVICLFNLFFQILVTAPFSWIVYKRKLAGNKEVLILKKALGRSTADLDFLRSQINPHFLFNALNTLYGTALQENAERTGEGIQRLGDMMRFMLQENMQEKILLAREIEYLNNYIRLQTLRTQSSPDIVTTLQIEEHVDGLQIAPMLLIPFVENAFKHGISLREPSHIKISLQSRGTELFFDVYNSIHAKPTNDPEKSKSGIGLENVKQRLQLLYPRKHDLVIRESAKEFFIHLTIQLS